MIAKWIKAKNLLPQISDTEREALQAGTVWVEREIFSGKPDFDRMLQEPYPELTAREKSFIDGPVEEVCGMVDDWELSRTRELPTEVWAVLRKHQFFGLTIPETYGGLNFSSLACSTIFGKLASHSLSLSAIVLIPNSVGPGKLLVEYGTETQKSHYLPRLARGDEIPCFALTEPNAGSDAASITSTGTVFRGGDGKLYLRLSWNKRYITLAPIATLIGLAFQLKDPENLLGRGPSVGITFALVSASLPGVEIGQLHDPMGIPMPNGPTSGADVIVSIDDIIGGPAYAGKGWKMLMESLSGGRAISLPAQAVGGAKWVSRVVGAYTVLRKQFGLAIGRFEGVQEPVARIAGLTYLMEAARVYTCGAVDSGKKSSVVSAIVKYNQTELMRKVVNDGMDVLGGAAMCRGPRNLLVNGYIGAPIGVTVEGANILTRTLIVFGQGAIRCHPYGQREIQALTEGDIASLARALGGHGAFFVRNLLRTLVLELSRGRLCSSPVPGKTARHYRRLSWASARFAVLSDLALLGLGSKLKFKENLTGRLADVLSWVFLGFSALRRFEAEGRKPEDLPLVDWAVEHSLAQAQLAFDGILANFDVPVLGALLRTVGRFWNRVNPLGAPPADALGSKVASMIQEPGSQRDRLTDGVYLPQSLEHAAGRLERAFVLTTRARPLLERIQGEVRSGRLPRGRPESLIGEAEADGILTAEEAALVRQAEAARTEVLQVDAFDLDELRGWPASAAQPDRRNIPLRMASCLEDVNANML